MQFNSTGSNDVYLIQYNNQLNVISVHVKCNTTNMKQTPKSTVTEHV